MTVNAPQAHPPLMSRDMVRSFPRSLQLAADVTANRIVKNNEIKLNDETLKKIIDRGNEIFEAQKVNPSQGKFSSKKSLVQQCFMDIWVKEWVNEVVNQIRPLKDTEDYCLVTERFEEGLDQVKFEIECRFNEIADQKASSLSRKIQFPFEMKEIVDEKIETSSKIKRLTGLRRLFNSKNY